MCFDFVDLFCLKHFSLQEELSEIWYICLYVKYSLYLSNFKETLNYAERFSKNPQISNFIKIRPVGVEIHMDERTDRQTWRS